MSSRTTFLIQIIIATIVNAAMFWLAYALKADWGGVLVVLALAPIVPVMIASLFTMAMEGIYNFASRLSNLSKRDKKEIADRQERNSKYDLRGWDSKGLAEKKDRLTKLNLEYGKMFLESRKDIMERLERTKEELRELEQVFEEDTPTN